MKQGDQSTSPAQKEPDIGRKRINIKATLTSKLVCTMKAFFGIFDVRGLLAIFPVVHTVLQQKLKD